MSNEYHYIYKIIFPTGHTYFGVRSCNCKPQEDPYLGSPYTHKDFWEKYTPIKKVLREFKTRKEAVEHEIIVIEWFWSINKDLSLNVHNNNQFNFKKCKHTEKTKKQISQKLKGTKRPLEVIDKIRNSQKTKNFTIVSPEGVVIEATNLSDFSKNNNLHRGDVQQLLRGEILHTKGWTKNLNSHKLYKFYFEKRGIASTGSRFCVCIKDRNNKKIYNYFKTYEDAKEFRDEKLTSGYNFITRTLGWKDKLKEFE